MAQVVEIYIDGNLHEFDYDDGNEEDLWDAVVDYMFTHLDLTYHIIELDDEDSDTEEIEQHD